MRKIVTFQARHPERSKGSPDSRLNSGEPSSQAPRDFVPGRGLIFLLMLACVGCMHHLNLTEGIHDFRTHHYHDAFVRLKPEAIHGQRDAEYAVGYMYYYGEGIVESRPKAIYWIRRAACEGQVEAQEAMKLLEIEYAYACQRLGERPYRIAEKTPPP